ncbi:GDSL-type esterase/lipase family protein [Tenacibaculum xiamenense]|uniref:GDSL-type esterase/lipase family protein n=1 Tax=Tenacibaculum xiamenense TaxID=1261553 RepID=UPI0038933FFA
MTKKKIVCLGDSLTEGYGVDISKRWSTLLSEDLNLEIINAGISGDTTSGMLSRFYETVARHKPNYVIIMGGTNDIWLNIPDNEIIGNILAMSRHARFYEITPIIGIPTTFLNLEDYNDESPFISVSTFSKRLSSFKNLLRKVFIDRNKTIIDFSSNMSSEMFLEDGLHPNELGHNQMFLNAKLVFDELGLL